MADVNEYKRKYKKECTIEVNVGSRNVVTATMLIETLSEYVTDIYACVPKGVNCYDVTLPSAEEAKILVDEHIVIGGQKLTFRLLFENSIVVSFMHLPTYIEDHEIETYLTSKGAVLKSDIKHRLIKGTNISDGTRYVRVEFTDTLKSLPYSVGFNTCDGYKYFRVLHNNQVKVCFKCNSPDHELRSCPLTKCFLCNGHGHYAKHCTVSKCDICGLSENICDCHDEDYTISHRNQDDYDADFPPMRGAREERGEPHTEEMNMTQTSTDNENGEIDTDERLDSNTEIKYKPKGRRNSEEWQLSTSKRARRTKLCTKVSDSVLKDNEYKNKMRVTRKDELKKRKDIQVNEKRELNKDDEENELSTS